MDMGLAARTARRDGLDHGGWFHPRRRAWLQRGDAAVRAGTRLADLCDRTIFMESLDGELRLDLGQLPGPGAPGFRATVRPSVQPRLDRLPRYPRQLYARARSGLFPEQPPGDVRPTRICDPQSDAVDGLQCR